MTDSMKFGPEWLRNMSAEPTNATGGVGGGTFSSSPSHLVSIHNNSGVGSVSHTPASRNMFPEFRYGREEMLSLFDRNCILPQILTSYKKLFVEKVQYPLALTPSSEDDINAQGPSVTTPRPSWLQRSPIGFSSSSRGTGRGGTVDRGRMRGKAVYHSLYQRPTALYEDSGSPLPLKPERGWSERNGTNDTSSVPGASGNLGLDWNGTPTSSPRKEFATQHRNTENWRRGRNDDGSGDGPVTGGLSTDGWRSNSSVSGSGGGGFGNNHRWVGRSTSWRDEESMPGNGNDPPGYGGINMQRSYSTIGTLGLERSVGSGFQSNNGAKNSSSGVVGIASATAKTTVSNAPLAKGSQAWSTGVRGSGGVGNSNHDAEDNLPEWAMENPSDMGGTFDASGAFHGETGDYDIIKKKVCENNGQEYKNSLDSKSQENDKACSAESVSLDSDGSDAPSIKRFVDSEICNVDEIKRTSPSLEKNDEELHCDKENKSPEEQSELCDLTNIENDSSRNTTEEQSDVPIVIIPEEAPKETPLLLLAKNAVPLGDISERLKEVADEVEKLIMDDDGGVIQKSNIQGALPSSTAGISGDFVSPGLAQMLKQSSQNDSQRTQLSESLSSNVLVGIPHKTLPFADQLSMQQQQLVATAGIPSHMLNSNPNDMWYYRDPQSNVQGPFSAIEMTEWYRAGYFNENLFVRRFNDSRFRPLGELIKICHGNMPFTHSHLIPSSLELDSLQIVANKSPAMTMNEQQRNEEQLKGNVTAAANSLSSAVKNHINTVGMSHMLTMQFQMLQDQYMQHQEHHIMKELSKNECFQRLSPPEREAIVRQKVQMLVLPEYLSSLNGLSNSLAALNPIAATQLYDAIAEQAKKQQLQQQQLFHGNGNQNQPRLEADDFIMNAQILHQQAQQQQHVQQYSVASVNPFPAPEDCNKIVHGGDNLSNNDLLNELSLRMFLRSGNGCQHQTKSNSGDYMTEPQLLSAPPAQNIMLPVWMPQFTSTTQSSVNTNQSSQLLGPQQSHQPHASHWAQGPSGGQLVGMETSDISPKSMSITLWDVSALEEAQSKQMLQKQQQQQPILEHGITNIEFNGTIQQLQQRAQHQQQLGKSQQQVQIEECTLSQHQAQNKQRKDDLQSINQQPNVKQNLGMKHQLQGKSQKNQEKQPGEEDRRREQAEEKRRVKEERKRQQLEEEKRRAHQIEDEKRRQILEEKERQQQIQAQRRKALLGTSSNNTLATAKVPTKVEQQRSHSSSIAPWSLQTGVTHSVGPGLAEIQKAERRERRADLLRQQEQLDKQLRANAVETTEAMLKWQSSPAPTHVMSLSEIQAEEAKRLANEQLEQQRRREQEQQQQSTLVASSGLGGNGISGVSNIWSGATKVWGGTTMINASPVVGTASFWDEPLKFNTTNNNGNAAAVAILTSGIQSVSSKQPQQSKSSVSPSARNLRKSQTMPTMQNAATSLATSSAKPSIKSGCGMTGVVGQAHEKNKIIQNKSQKPYEDKKIITKQNSGPNCSSNKASEYENEFTIWCMKSLSNMSAKVDVPTFVSFLQDLEAPYEVKDYIRIYLGEGRESTDFAKQFLERRSKYKNLQRAQNAHNDDMCKPAPAITPSGNDNSDNKNKQKKIKKSKMTKLDARILGFSVTAAEGRINVGDRDYVDGP